MENINFVAFDFETATSEMSACQLGLVVVRGGKIVEEKTYLFQPPGNEYSPFTIKVHGITPKMTENSPTFAELWDEIRPYFHQQVLVSHGGSNSFDMLVLEKEINKASLARFRPLAVINTYDIFLGDSQLESRSLDYLCKTYGVALEQHHDGLCDARACGELYIKYLMEETPDYSVEYVSKRKKSSSRSNQQSLQEQVEYKAAKAELLKQDVDIETVSNTNTIFYNKRLVISGVFERYPFRDELILLLEEYGGQLKSSLSKKTDFFIYGYNAGPSKILKAMELVEGNLQVLNEKKLYKILDSIPKEQ